MSALASLSEHPGGPEDVPGRALVPRVLRRLDSVRSVRELLRYELLHGRARSGSATPLRPETELAREYATSRNVIRLVLLALQREGIVERVPGAGTFVVTARARHRQERLRGLADSLGRDSVRVRQVPQLVELRPASPPVARTLEVEVGAEVLVVERKGYYDGRPCSLTTRYLPAELAPALIAGDLSRLDWYGAIEAAAGVELSGARVLTEATLADEALAPEIDAVLGSAVLLMQRVVYTVDDRPVELSFSRVRGDAFENEIWLERR